MHWSSRRFRFISASLVVCISESRGRGGDCASIDLSSNGGKRECLLTCLGLCGDLDEYAPPFQDFMGGRVVITLVIMSPMLLGFRVVPPGLPLATMPLVVLLTLPSLGIGLSRPWLPMPKFVGRATLGNQVDPPNGRCSLIF